MKVRDWRIYGRADWNEEEVSATESNPQVHVMHEVEYASCQNRLHLIGRTFTFTSELFPRMVPLGSSPYLSQPALTMHRLIPVMAAVAILVGLGVLVVFQI